MAYQRITLPAFSVIGKEGTTLDGQDFVSRLWDSANSAFQEIAHLAAGGENGSIRVWGLMSDMSMKFLPWEDNFSKGRYLAGIEVSADAQPPEGWVKWTSPAYEYISAPADSPDAFPRAIDYLAENGYTLVGAAYDMMIPGEGNYILLPVKKL